MSDQHTDWSVHLEPDPPATTRPAPPADPADPTSSGQGDASAPFFADCEAWLTQWLLPTWTRAQSQSSVWCPQWWMHPEALSRIESMWRAWEELRLDAGTGMSSWWRDHGDYHLSVLSAAHGPFKGCTLEKGHRTRAVPVLPAQPAPAGLFDDDFL